MYDVYKSVGKLHRQTFMVHNLIVDVFFISFQLANAKLQQEALQRKTRHVVKASDHDIPVGTWVYLHNHILRRIKIQDNWNSTPYRVVKRVDPISHAYIVEPLLGKGPTKTVNPSQLLPSESLAHDEVPEVPPGCESDEARKKKVVCLQIMYF